MHLIDIVGKYIRETQLSKNWECAFFEIQLGNTIDKNIAQVPVEP